MEKHDSVSRPGAAGGTGLRGILRTGSGAPPFRLARHPPRRELAGIVEDYWVTRWERRPSVRQQVLPHPCVHLVVDGDQSGVFGLVTGRFARSLAEAGRAFGVKFWPGAFHCLLGRPVASIANRRLPLRELFGEAGARFQREVLAADRDAELVRLADAFLLARRPLLDAQALLARQVVERIGRDPELASVDQVVAAVGIPKRRLQRLFRSYVGASPKWLIQRYRLHEAIERLGSGRRLELAELAAQLGYCDQSHFIRAFKRIVGRSPGEYARALRAPVPSRAAAGSGAAR